MRSRARLETDKDAERERQTHYVRWGNSAVIEVEVHVIDAVSNKVLPVVRLRLVQPATHSHTTHSPEIIKGASLHTKKKMWPYRPLRVNEGPIEPIERRFLQVKSGAATVDFAHITGRGPTLLLVSSMQ